MFGTMAMTITAHTLSQPEEKNAPAKDIASNQELVNHDERLWQRSQS